MEKMLMQNYIEDYAKFLCLEENEGTLFYFLLNRDRHIAVGRGPGVFQDRNRLYIYQQTEKDIIKYYLN